MSPSSQALACSCVLALAMDHNLCLHFGADEHLCTTYFDVHQGYRVLTHSPLASLAGLYRGAVIARSRYLSSRENIQPVTGRVGSRVSVAIAMSLRIRTPPGLALPHLPQKCAPPSRQHTHIYTHMSHVTCHMSHHRSGQGLSNRSGQGSQDTESPCRGKGSCSSAGMT